jgi:hypothetical protein
MTQPPCQEQVIFLLPSKSGSTISRLRSIFEKYLSVVWPRISFLPSGISLPCEVVEQHR